MKCGSCDPRDPAPHENKTRQVSGSLPASRWPWTCIHASARSLIHVYLLCLCLTSRFADPSHHNKHCFVLCLCDASLTVSQPPLTCDWHPLPMHASPHAAFRAVYRTGTYVTRIRPHQLVRPVNGPLVVLTSTSTLRIRDPESSTALWKERRVVPLNP